MNKIFQEKARQLQPPTLKGRYEDSDCIFVLKDIGAFIQEEENEIRESKMNQGLHYSEMLPIEKYPSHEYLELFHQALQKTSEQVAQYIADVSEMIIHERGKGVVLVSLARAGTPVGVLIKRFIQYQYGIDVPHYSISIIRDKGIDENALIYIMNKHYTENLIFIDGWTGKGVIGKVLSSSLQSFNQKYQTNLSDELVALADPAHSADIYGTREDFFLPSACLNSIVSGLISRTAHRADLVGEYDYHGAKYYAEWEEKDLSLLFVDEITKKFPSTILRKIEKKPATMQGWKEIEEIQRHFGIEDINKIKPSIGETTRVLLRRVPSLILVKELDNPNLCHIFVLARDKKVPIRLFPNMSYACIGLIRE